MRPSRSHGRGRASLLVDGRPQCEEQLWIGRSLLGTPARDIRGERTAAAGRMMRFRTGGWLTSSVIAAVLWGSTSHAGVVVPIDKSSQRMSVSVDGATRQTGRSRAGCEGYGTPGGTFHPQAMMRSYFSKTYCDAPIRTRSSSIRLRHPGHQRHFAPRRAGLARLRPPASSPPGAVRAGPAQGATMEISN
jgi:hypothetical protein